MTYEILREEENIIFRMNFMSQNKMFDKQSEIDSAKEEIEWLSIALENDNSAYGKDLKSYINDLETCSNEKFGDLFNELVEYINEILKVA